MKKMSDLRKDTVALRERLIEKKPGMVTIDDLLVVITLIDRLTAAVEQLETKETT